MLLCREIRVVQKDETSIRVVQKDENTIRKERKLLVAS
jgi:hypothetical protein